MWWNDRSPEKGPENDDPADEDRSLTCVCAALHRQVVRAEKDKAAEDIKQFRFGKLLGSTTTSADTAPPVKLPTDGHFLGHSARSPHSAHSGPFSLASSRPKTLDSQAAPFNIACPASPASPAQPSGTIIKTGPCIVPNPPVSKRSWWMIGRVFGADRGRR